MALKAYSSAQDCFADAASIFHEFGDRPSEVRARCNLGVSHLALTDTKIAKQELRKSLAMSRDLHDRVVEVQSLHHLTILCEAQGQTTEALKYAREAHTILASQEDAPALRQITAKINRLAAQT